MLYLHLGQMLCIGMLPITWASLGASEPFDTRPMRRAIAMQELGHGQLLKGLDSQCLVNEGDDRIGHA